MDDRRFDGLTRMLGQLVARRAAFGSLLAAVVAPLTMNGVDGAPEAERCIPAGERCGKKARGNRGPCKKCCSRQAVTTPNGRRRCVCKRPGANCGNASQCCGGECSGGQCGPCPPGSTDCPAGCIDLTADPHNCGACGAACLGGDVCAAGSCAPPYTFETVWGSSGDALGEFSSPVRLGADGQGRVFVTDRDNNRVQRFSNDGANPFAWGSFGSALGEFDRPEGIAVNNVDQVYVADSGNNRIQRFDSNGNAPFQIGEAGAGFGSFNFPEGVAVGPGNQVFVGDTANDLVQIFTSDGVFVGQWGEAGTDPGQIDFVQSVAVDRNNNVFLVDFGSCRVQKFSSAGVLITFWGDEGDEDGNFEDPTDVAVDRDGNVYIADSGNNRIQKFDNNGRFITKWGGQGSGDGQFEYPEGVTVDRDGNVFVADTGNDRVQKFRPTLGPTARTGNVSRRRKDQGAAGGGQDKPGLERKTHRSRDRQRRS